MLTTTLRKISGTVIAAFLVSIIGGTASADPLVQCSDPLRPETCVLSTSIPGRAGGDQQNPDVGTGTGGITPNDGSGSAAQDAAARAAALTEGSSPDTAPDAGAPRAVNSTECDWFPASPQPAAGDARWGGADPAANTMIENDCNGPSRFAVVANGNPVAGGAAAPAPPPPPDPAVLAQQAIGELRIPKPVINLGPDPNRVAVNFWTWLWLGDSPPTSSTVALRGVSVTATATLSSVDWSMGEPLSLDGGGIGSVTCQGPGVAPSANADFSEPPPCGYMFKYRSLQERTNGVGKWPVAATATWSVSWTASTGQTGADSLSASSTTSVEVGEYRTTRGTGG